MISNRKYNGIFSTIKNLVKEKISTGLVVKVVELLEQVYKFYNHSLPPET